MVKNMVRLSAFYSNALIKHRPVFYTVTKMCTSVLVIETLKYF